MFIIEMTMIFQVICLYMIIIKNKQCKVMKQSANIFDILKRNNEDICFRSYLIYFIQSHIISFDLSGLNKFPDYMIEQKSLKKLKVKEAPRITVAVRKRPMNKKQLQKAETDIVRVDDHRQITISEYKQKVDLTKYLQETSFNFDYVYDQTSNNQQIYEESIRPLIENAFMGAKISCFAYGQTGSGKTHTMKGDMNKGIPGLYFLGARQIFYYIQQPQFKHMHVTVSFYEIYCGRLHDLLNNRAELKIREDNKQNINVIGLEEKIIRSAQQFLDIIQYGSGFRVTSQNATNADSSRSHAILQISLKQNKKVFTKISFIDLAGNERGADHMDQNKQTKIDGAQINKSLLSLKECIRALDQGKGHTPFRGSKLTMVLKDSFVGFCNTVMICNVSPNSSSSQNTMNTLRYADRVKELKGSQSEPLTKAEKMQRQLMLPRANKQNVVKVNIDNNDDNDDIMMKMEQARNVHNNTNHKNKLGYQQKMQIQEPYELKKGVLNFDKRKVSQTPPTDYKTNFQNPIQKKSNSLTGKQLNFQKQLKSPSEIPQNLYNKSKDHKNVQIHEKYSIPSKNSINKVDNISNMNNNIINGSFQSDFELNKKAFKNLSNLSSNQSSFIMNNQQLMKQHSEAMNTMRLGFERYRQHHENLVKQQMNMLKQQMLLKEDFGKITNSSYEEQIDNASVYLNSMEELIVMKIQLLKSMKNNIDKVKINVRNAEELTDRLRNQQMTKDYQMQQHSQRLNKPSFSQNQYYNGMSNNMTNSSNNLNGMGNMSNFQNMRVSSSNIHGIRNQNRLSAPSNNINFNEGGYNQYGDEQLLEGLSEDDSNDRLF